MDRMLQSGLSEGGSTAGFFRKDLNVDGLIRSGTEITPRGGCTLTHILSARELVLSAEVAETILDVFSKRGGSWLTTTSAATFETHTPLIASLSARGHYLFRVPESVSNVRFCYKREFLGV